MMDEIVKVREKFNKISEYWTPGIIAELNGHQVKIAKVKGEFVWHDHEKEDELFYIVKGRLHIDFEDRTITLEEGDMYVVKKKTRHRPRTDEGKEAWIMLLEPKSTLHTGNEKSDLTNNEQQYL